MSDDTQPASGVSVSVEKTFDPAKAYAKLDGDSLDAIVEVIGSPALYNSGKSAMRHWFLGRLRRLWELPDPPSSGAAGGKE